MSVSRTSSNKRVKTHRRPRPRTLLFLAVGWFLLSGADLSPLRAEPNANRVVQFREPHPTSYTLEPAPAAASTATGLASAAAPASQWTRATVSGNPGNPVEIGSRVVLQLEPGESLENVLQGHPLTLSRTVAPDLFILQAADSAQAIAEAGALAVSPGVIASYPVMRRAWRKQAAYAPTPNDPYFDEQWHLDNRGSDRNRAGLDLNVRAAWTVTRGEGVIVGVGDDGAQTTHPDLSARFTTGLNYNFFRGVVGGTPASESANHGTAVSGLIGAEDNNGKGLCGVAPRAQLASWVLFGISFGFENFVTDEQLMDLFQYASNRVSIQNHSWGNATLDQLPMGQLPSMAVENVVTRGRGGRGGVIVRAAGNSRGDSANANDDGFADDPRVVTVAAVRQDGRVCSYSSPGTCILVGGPSGDEFLDEGFGPPTPNVRTTDRTGDNGYEQGSTDAANYTGFNGTSASSPQIAGVAALIVSANTNLTYRDVQAILTLSARHHHLDDPAVQTNGAGFRVSHNVGFGVPDAGVAVELARTWSNLPAPTRIMVESRTRRVIPDDALRVGGAGTDIPAALRSIQCLPSLGAHPDVPTGNRPLVYVGQANGPITQDLTGKAALIQRGTSLFADKIERAAQAGAAMAVIFNNTGVTDIQAMGGTTLSRIPAVSIGQNAGEALRDYAISNPQATAKLLLIPTFYTLGVSNTMICQHVGVRLKTTHTRRMDVRVTLISPMGTRSVLQAINFDGTPGPVDWTYWSTLHFYESSAGDWRVEVSDERATVVDDPVNGAKPATGAVTLVQLLIDGIPITDTDRDGLDDDWERSALGDLAQGPRDDPDRDGYTNAREQILRTNPLISNAPLHLEWAEIDPGFWRLVWPAREGVTYSLLTGASLNQKFSSLASVPGQFPITERVIRAPSDPGRFYEVRDESTP